jgi:hypothetical protein
MQARKRSLALAAVAASAALPAVAQARPADVMIVNPAPIPVSGTVQIDPGQNTVQLGGQPIAVKPFTPFHAYEFIPSPASVGGKKCVAFDIPAGQHQRVDTVTITTYNDAGAVAYLRYFVKEGNSSSRILALRVVTTAVGNDPVTNSRSAVLQWGAQVAGGNVFDTQLGELHSINGCIQSSSGNSATGTFTLDGIAE